MSASDNWNSPGWKKAAEGYHAKPRDHVGEVLASAGRLHVDRGTHATRVPPRVINGGNQPAKRTAIEKMALGFPDMTETGKIRNTCNNARFAIGKMQITCEYNEFHDKLVIGGKPIGQYAGELSDHACLILRKMIEEQYEFDPGRERMFDACIQLCLERRFDPVLAYLDGLKWDGIDRVDKWLTSYLGAADTPLNRAIGKIALVAQVRRARRPGCKFDQIIVMESPEGFLKSTALSILAGAPENFSDHITWDRTKCASSLGPASARVADKPGAEGASRTSGLG